MRLTLRFFPVVPASTCLSACLHPQHCLPSAFSNTCNHAAQVGEVMSVEGAPQGLIELLKTAPQHLATEVGTL